MTSNLRSPPIRSKAYLRAAKGQPCAFQIPNVCCGNTETTVAGHIRDEHTGRGVKASDISSADICESCHRVLDGHGSFVLSKEDWLFYALRGLQRTLENRIRRGIITIPMDEPKLRVAKPVAARKPIGERQKIAGRSNFPKGRKLQSRNDLRKRDE